MPKSYLVGCSRSQTGPGYQHAGGGRHGAKLVLRLSDRLPPQCAPSMNPHAPEFPPVLNAAVAVSVKDMHDKHKQAIKEAMREDASEHGSSDVSYVNTSIPAPGTLVSGMPIGADVPVAIPGDSSEHVSSRIGPELDAAKVPMKKSTMPENDHLEDEPSAASPSAAFLAESAMSVESGQRSRGRRQLLLPRPRRCLDHPMTDNNRTFLQQRRTTLSYKSDLTPGRFPPGWWRSDGGTCRTSRDYCAGRPVYEEHLADGNRLRGWLDPVESQARTWQGSVMLLLSFREPSYGPYNDGCHEIVGSIQVRSFPDGESNGIETQIRVKDKDEERQKPVRIKRIDWD